MDRNEAIKTLWAIHDKYARCADRAAELDAAVLADDYGRDRDAVRYALDALGVDG